MLRLIHTMRVLFHRKKNAYYTQSCIHLCRTHPPVRATTVLDYDPWTMANANLRRHHTHDGVLFCVRHPPLIMRFKVQLDKVGQTYFAHVRMSACLPACLPESGPVKPPPRSSGAITIFTSPERLAKSTSGIIMLVTWRRSAAAEGSPQRKYKESIGTAVH